MTSRDELRRPLLLAVLSALAVCALAPAAAQAALQWWPAESLPSVPSGASVGPDGAGLVFGFGTAAGYTRVVVRPSGGPPGNPQPLPGTMGYGGGPLIVGWFADGSSLIADPGTDLLAFRPSGAAATIGTPQNLGPGEGPSAIATAPSGAALIGLSGNLGVGVASRSPGAGGTVDMKHAQYFGPGRLIGVVLDPNGGAVVAWVDANTSILYQAVRSPGGTSFGSPTQIYTQPYRAAMAADPSGYAVLSWIGGPPGPDSYGTEVFATERAPAGAFGAPQQVGDSPNGDPQSTYPGITSNGDAIVGWTRIAFGGSSFGAEIAIGHSGSWGTEQALGGAGTQIGGIASAGNHLLVASGTQSNYVAQPGSSGQSGISLGAPMSVPAAPTAMAVGASGTALYLYGQSQSGQASWWLLPYEDRTTASAAPPVNSSPPTISGAATLGQKLSSSTGGWSGTAPLSYAYQWQRCNPACANVAGATGSVYKLVAADGGARIRVVVTASNAAGHASADSSQVGPVTPTLAVLKVLSLRNALARQGKNARIAALLKHGGYSLTFTALTAGRVVFSWYLVPKGAHITKGKATAILVANGTTSFSMAGSMKMKIKLTARGKQLLRHVKRLKLTGKGTFSSAGQARAVALDTFTLRR